MTTGPGTTAAELTDAAAEALAEAAFRTGELGTAERLYREALAAAQATAGSERGAESAGDGDRPGGEGLGLLGFV